jgi:hypothetical protein
MNTLNQIPNQIPNQIVKKRIDIDKLLKVDIKYEKIEKIKTIKSYSRRNVRYREKTLSNKEIINKINSRLSEIKKYLSDFVDVSKKLEDKLNSIISDNKNVQSSDNWRKEILNEYKNKLVKEQQLNSIQNKINLIKEKITQANQFITNYERDLLCVKKEEENLNRERKEYAELNPIISMFNEKMPYLNLMCPYLQHPTDCNCHSQKLNKNLPSEKLKLNIYSAQLIKKDSIEQILFQYNSIKKCLNEKFNLILAEQVCNNFTSKYSIKHMVSTGLKIYDGNNLHSGEPFHDIIFLHFNYLKSYFNHDSEFEKNIIKLLNVFIDLIVFIRPDIDEYIRHN